MLTENNESHSARYPTTAKEYWAVLASPNVPFAANMVWGCLRDQISPLVERTGDTARDTQVLISEIIALPFPDELGLLDSREYDHICRGVLEGLNHMIEAQGGVPEPLPGDAPRTAQVSAQAYDWGSMRVISGGSARALEADDRKFLEKEAALSSEKGELNNTEACKEKLAEHYSSDPEGANPGSWIRVSKYAQGRGVVRVFRTRSGSLEATVLYDPGADDLSKALTVFEKVVTPPAPGQFGEPVGERFSGKVLFSVAAVDGDELHFYCGPATSDGFLDDQEDEATCGVLRELFPDYKIEVGAAENFHIIIAQNGQSMDELRKVVTERLTRAGADMMDDEPY